MIVTAASMLSLGAVVGEVQKAVEAHEAALRAVLERAVLGQLQRAAARAAEETRRRARSRIGRVVGQDPGRCDIQRLIDQVVIKIVDGDRRPWPAQAIFQPLHPQEIAAVASSGGGRNVDLAKKCAYVSNSCCLGTRLRWEQPRNRLRCSGRGNAPREASGERRPRGRAAALRGSERAAPAAMRRATARSVTAGDGHRCFQFPER